jgi:hypothetical protein
MKIFFYHCSDNNEDRMAHFTSKENLKAFLDARQVTALFANIPSEIEASHFDYTDTLITAKTEVSPSDSSNDPILVSIASRIVIWFLSGTQQWNDSNKPEIDRREKLFNAAIKELDEVADGSLKLKTDVKEETVKPCCGSAPHRMEHW